MNIHMMEDCPPWDWPPTAKQTILGVLEDKSQPEEDRQLAARLAGDLVVVDDDVAVALLGRLRDAAEPEGIRSAAAISFGPTLEMAEDDDPEEPESPVSAKVLADIKQTLRTVHEDETAAKVVRRRALEASVRGGAEWHAAAVTKAYATNDTEWKMTAVFCMRYVQGFQKEILETLNGDNDELLYDAVLTAGDNGLQEAWPRITSILQDEDGDRDLLFAAIMAATSMPNEEAHEELQRLSESEDEEIAEAASEALLEWGIGDDDEFEDDEDFEDEDEEAEDSAPPHHQNGHGRK